MVVTGTVSVAVVVAKVSVDVMTAVEASVVLEEEWRHSGSDGGKCWQ